MELSSSRVLGALLALLLALSRAATTAVAPRAPPSCPRPCACPQPLEVHCTFRSLFAIPAAVPKHVKRMNLGFNSISKITESSLTGLRKLELLLLHGNDIQDLPDGAFKDLHSLQMLKISYNKVRKINRHTFRGLWALARLHLDHNHLELIHPDAFHGLTSLRLLQLEGNRLQQLHPATFATFTLLDHFHISTLKHLYLSDNELTALPAGLVATMPQLENLNLHGNPWMCDCNMRWLQGWHEKTPGVLKCKKDKALPEGQLCPVCSSPRRVLKEPLLAVKNLECSRPVITTSGGTSSPDDVESELMTTEDFANPFGNVSLGLSDEHGNKVDLECIIREPRDLSSVSWEQPNELELSLNISLSVDIECLVDRGRYEQLWRLIAYYSSFPAHLQRGTMIREKPQPSYTYKQDPEKDGQYYTGVKVDVSAQPSWLMQQSAGLQLNRLRSSAKVVYLVLSTYWAETAEVELLRTQRRTWVTIESTNKTRKASSAMLGAPTQMDCNVHSSGPATILWTLPDGTTVEAPYSSADNRVSVSAEGRLAIKAVRHVDTGIYYCAAKVEGDIAMLPFYLSVQEPSSPPSGEENVSAVSVEGFVGGPISLPCSTSGSPDANVCWILPSNDAVGFQANASRVFIFPNGTLHIPQTQLTDIGYYKCIAVNQHGVDTAATRVALVRRKVAARPLRRFPARPQSASGINTQVKVPTENAEEASGESEVPQAVLPRKPLEPIRRRIPGNVATGRRGIHLSRRPWRRPLLRKPTGPHLEERKVFVDSRSKMNSSKSKIDPEKWADILAKIRDRKAQTTGTPLPAQQTTEGPVLESTIRFEVTTEGSSDDVTPLEEAWEEDYTTTAQTPVKQTQTSTKKQDMQVQGVHVTDISSVHETEAMTQTAHRIRSTYATEGPQTMHHVQSINPDTNLNVRTTSNSVPFLPQTTSASANAVTAWQENTNTGGILFPPAGDRDGGVGATQFVDGGGSNSLDLFNVSKNTFLFSRPSGWETNKEESGKYISEAATTSQTEPEAVTQDSLQPQILSFLTEAPLPSGARSRPRLRGPNGRKKNGNRRKRPNGKKQRLNKVTCFTTATPVHSLAVTERATTSLSGVTEASFSSAVLLSSSQAVSLDTPSQEESTALLLGASAITEHSVAAPPQETNGGILPHATQLFESTTATRSLSTVAGGRILAPPTALGTLEASSPTGRFSGHAAANPQPETLRLPTPGLSEEAHLARNDPELWNYLENCSGDFCTVTQMPTNTQTDLSMLNTPTQRDETGLMEERDTYFSPLAPSPTVGLLFDPESTSEGLLVMPSGFFVVDKTQYSTEGISTPEEMYHSPSQSSIPNSESEGLRTANPSQRSSSASFTSRSVISTTGVRYAVATTPAGHDEITSLSATTVAAGYNQIQQTLASHRTSDLRRVTHPTNYNLHLLDVHPTSPAAELITREAGQQVAAPVPTVSALQTGAPGQGPPSSTLSTYEKHQQLPRQGSAPGRKPSITKSNFQTYAVRAEADVRLPCKAEGEPIPFLSWTKVASGASVAQNSRVQRFEVDLNGTLIIRNAHPTDGGQYLCTAQNQHGVDKMVVTLVIQSQHPRILHPRQRDFSVDEGGNILLDCIAEGHPLPLVTWVLPNHAHLTAAPLGVFPHKHISVLINGTLWISEATYADRGVYKCIGSSTAGTDTVLVRLQVSMSPPSIQQKQIENATFPEGSTAYIHCTTSGTQRPVIHWITPSGVQHIPSQSPTGNVYVLSNGTLIIRRLSPGNSGRYECLAGHTLATSRRVVFVNIQRSPSATRAKITLSSPQRTDVIYGGSLLLNCVAKGEPDPWILWRTPSKKLVDSQYSFDSRIKVSPNGTITIHSVTEKDSGDYLCSARNKMGDDYVLLRVNVLTRPAKIKHAQQQSSQELVYGGDLKVDCVASGLPNPKITWALPDGTRVNPDKQRDGFSGARSRRYVVFDNGTLYFNDIGMPEEGDYTCYAENKVGKDEMKVRVKVKVATSPPLIQDKNQKVVRVPHGETVTLRCNATGEVVPVITWISPANRVVMSALDKYQIFDDGTLMVKKVQHDDAGNYTCLAQNSAGQDQKVIKLEVYITLPVINGLGGTLSFMKVKAFEEQHMFIDCVTKGIPTPNVTWVLPGNVVLPVPHFSNRITVHQNGTLEIRSAKMTDSGQLSCKAQNEGGEVRLLVSLDVREAVEMPQVRDPKPESISLTVGNPMTLNCSFKGSTLPHVTWILPNGLPLRSGARFSKFYHRPDGSLIISNPSLVEAGMYRCMGRVPQGIMEHTVTLSPGRKAEIINRYQAPVSIMIGESLPLHCKTGGDPVRLTWTLPSGVVLNRPQRAGRYNVLSNGTLLIQQISIYDRGSYVCRVANEYGSSLLPVSVSVIAYPPHITSGPPSVTYAKRGVAIQLNCIANGIPRADVAWETPDKTRLVVGAQPRLFGNRYLHPQGSLIIQNPTQRDAGVYRCTARNAIGIDSRATFLNVF